jgi:hypothetical protein
VYGWNLKPSNSVWQQSSTAVFCLL